MLSMTLIQVRLYFQWQLDTALNGPVPCPILPPNPIQGVEWDNWEIPTGWQ